MSRYLPNRVATLLLVGLPTMMFAQFAGLFAGSLAVPEVNVGQLMMLNADLADGGKKFDGQHVIVDVRTPEEYQVSMIPGAVTKVQFEKNKQQYRDCTIVVYCTIGYRSGQYAKKLMSDGFNAKNFKGSILAWCHAGLPLVTMQGEPTYQVHTYSSEYKVPSKYTAVF